MYYINSLYFYSLIGFIMESTVYKISKSKRHSGICYGPYTFVYGFGVLFLILLKKYFLDRLKINKYYKILVTFILCVVVLTFVEWLGGNILNIVFDIDMWDYSNIKPNFGKYICLQNSIIWGILGTIYIHIFKVFTDKIIKAITYKETYLFLTIFIIDMILVLINKL